jgi:hypothetical protein
MDFIVGSARVAVHPMVRAGMAFARAKGRLPAANDRMTGK